MQHARPFWSGPLRPVVVQLIKAEANTKTMRFKAFTLGERFTCFANQAERARRHARKRGPLHEIKDAQAGREPC